MTSQILLVILLLSFSSSLSSTFIPTTAPTFPYSSAATPSSPPPATAETVSYDLQDQSFFSHTALLVPILSHLGFNELSMAAPSLSSDSTATAWSGPSTLFAPSDSSVRSCFSCSVPNLLREHIVPGLFTIDYLRKLSFGTKIETLSPGHCITVTSSSVSRKIATSASPTVVEKVFVGGVEITQPDLFNNGLVVIHGIQGYISPLSPFSCDFERLNTLSSFPDYSPPTPTTTTAVDARAWIHGPSAQLAMMRLMMRDAMLRLRNNGFSVLSLAMRVKYAELVALNNFTIFALDDVSIFSGSHSYISSIRFHIVPNKYLSGSDLEKLPVGATLSTLERDQSLVVTSNGAESGYALRINYVRMKVGEVVKNLKIVVHSLYLPFPRIHPNHHAYVGSEESVVSGGGSSSSTVGSEESVVSGGGSSSSTVGGEENMASGAGGSSSNVGEAACLAVGQEDGSCDSAANTTMSPTPSMKATVVDTDDHYGL